jgi:hypothetical protein
MDGGKCLITGCALVFPQDEIAHWGDLFEFEGLYAFNAVVHKLTQQPVFDTYDADRPAIFVGDTPIMQHNGIFLIPQKDAAFNPTATAYLTRKPKL